MLKPDDLSGVPEDLARTVIAYAVTVAPCLDALPAEDVGDADLVELRKRALAVLRQVARHAVKRGSVLVKAERVGSASVDYGVVSSSFDDDSITSLQGICSRLCGGSRLGALTLGRFPKPGLVSEIWREGDPDGI